MWQTIALLDCCQSKNAIPSIQLAEKQVSSRVNESLSYDCLFKLSLVCAICLLGKTLVSFVGCSLLKFYLNVL